MYPRLSNLIIELNNHDPVRPNKNTTKSVWGICRIRRLSKENNMNYCCFSKASYVRWMRKYDGTGEATRIRTYGFLCVCNQQIQPPPTFLSDCFKRLAQCWEQLCTVNKQWIYVVESFSVFRGPNLKADVKAAANRNPKRIGIVIWQASRRVSPWRTPNHRHKWNDWIECPWKNGGPFFDDEGKSTSGGPVCKMTKTTSYGVDESDEDISLRTSKRQKTSSTM